MSGSMKRRTFMGQATAGVLAFGAPAIVRSRVPSDTVGIGCIGLGVRGHILHNKCLNNMADVEVRCFSDLYTGFQKRAVETSTNPKMRFYHDYRRVIDDPNVDAVVICVPDFWHARMAIEAAQAGKDIYLEKPVTHTMPEAVELHKVIKSTGQVFQLGHQRNSDPVHYKAKEIVESGVLGKICLVRTMWFRHNAIDVYRVYATYTTAGLPADASLDTIDWDTWQSNARTKHPFSAERFFHWHCFNDYGTAVAGDLLSHEMDAMNLIMDAGFPDSCVASGQLNYWKDDREIDDTFYAIYQYPDRDLTVTWEYASHNSMPGEGTCYYGDKGTLEVSMAGLKVYAEGYNDLYKHFTGTNPGGKTIDSAARKKPVYEFAHPRDANDDLAHMRDFIDNVKSRGQCSCHIDKALDEAAYVHMALEATRLKRQVRWDQAARKIV
jgi:predicted dehydrogenase